MTTQAERYRNTQERLKTAAIFAIFKKQKAQFVALLEKEDAKQKAFIYSYKADFLDPFIDEIAPDIPEYLVKVLPAIMTEGGKDPIKKYKKLLPNGYSFAFDIETSPASQYLRDLEDLYLSTKDGSILKTTRDELRRILADGVDAGKSYGQIAKEIATTDPFVFSKSRAKLIATNEVGRAYGWGSFEPARVLSEEGYEMQKIWATSRDEKVRKAHRENENAGYIPLDDEFPGTGDMYAPSTNTINCRCTSTTKIVGTKHAHLAHKLDAFFRIDREAKTI